MSRKRDGSETIVIANENGVSIAKLPHELLLEIWHRLPPLERLCVSQTCVLWRSLALATPRLWTRLAVVSGYQPRKRALVSTEPIQSTASNIFKPCDGSDNLDLLDELLLRSKQLPLDLTIVWRAGSKFPVRFDTIMKPHSSRISRIHVANGSDRGFHRLVRNLGGLPSLRTLTAGFNEDDVEYADLPVRLVEGCSLPALNQIHLGAGAEEGFVRWLGPSGDSDLLGVTELTLTPRGAPSISPPLTACTNLQRLTLVMAKFSDRFFRNEPQVRAASLVGLLVRLPELCITDFPPSREPFVRHLTNDGRFRAVTLDYQGRRPASLSSDSRLPGLCDSLSGPVHLALTLRESVYEIQVIDSAQRRRAILLDSSAISKAPGLWNGYIKKLAVASAAVDAVAWTYFSAGIPDHCAIPDLTITILHHPDELDNVSLAHVFGLQKLRIDVLQHSLRFPATAISRLVQSWADSSTSLLVFALTQNACFGDADCLSLLANNLEH